MIEKQIVIKDSVGFHARTASLFAKKAARFESDVAIVFNGKKVNGKSTLSLMTLGVKSQDEIAITVSGKDESLAMESLVTLIENNFKD
ncbi:HPr family phosphocarrier protein [Flavobacteriaceae bacterium]|jgi:phosphotransferase system HPr (HPr) family protein|nr:HPr family phosphocarrier protein [Flavobacteriaceae bacterium]MDA0278717.1 HPr family phosphocarrier protein [Bacteroidota bacterium]MDB4027492.1 HPr family phosphocarrier protein [bacterium]MBT4314163.1 HPr family phosphocarrier protein [Flavobacteriaceae bacterium]MBT5092501.1 HPr family phosphocarrier protein [Flavobacteriaceae bacterium]|tara:strand:+ start:1047 stop:1310 length:264 start_codon:yes stop_codon:yes gene_type:complete